MKNFFKRILQFTVLVFITLISVVFVKTFMYTSRQVLVSAPQPIAIHTNEAAQRLAQGLTFKTIANMDPTKMDQKEFQGLLDYLEQAFPKAHQTLKKEKVGEYSLLFTWQGRQPSLKPILLMAHLDVVPVEPGTESNWIQPPFGGKIIDTFVWGRGAIDDKVGVFGVLEAVETLLEQGVEPQRTIYLAFGQDEEVGGQGGAVRIASLLESRGVSCEYILDEGMVITDGVLSEVSAPVALIGIAEKGFLSLELTVQSEGGHSSMPPQQTSIGILSTAISKLEAHPLPGGLEGISRDMFDQIGPEMSFSKRLVFANLWLFHSLVEHQLAKLPSTNAMLRTTTATTIFEAGNRDNVLPIKARAVVNFRVRPGDTFEKIIEHTRQTINDPRVQIKAIESTSQEPSHISQMNSFGYQAIHTTVRQVFPKAIVAPALVVGATDARHYAKLSQSIFRFLPIRVTPQDISRYHGTNERISVSDYSNCVKFYAQIIRNSAF